MASEWDVVSDEPLKNLGSNGWEPVVDSPLAKLKGTEWEPVDDAAPSPQPGRERDPAYLHYPKALGRGAMQTMGGVGAYIERKGVEKLAGPAPVQTPSRDVQEAAADTDFATGENPFTAAMESVAEKTGKTVDQMVEESDVSQTRATRKAWDNKLAKETPEAKQRRVTIGKTLAGYGRAFSDKAQEYADDYFPADQQTQSKPFDERLSDDTTRAVLTAIVENAPNTAMSLGAAKIMGKLGKTGAYTGAAGSSYVLESGDIFQTGVKFLEQKYGGFENVPDHEFGRLIEVSQAHGLFNAGLDALMPGNIASAAARRQLAERAIQKLMSGKSAKEIGGSTIKNAFLELAPELVQEDSSIVGESRIGIEHTPRDIANRKLQAGIAGGGIGGITGAASGVSDIRARNAEVGTAGGELPKAEDFLDNVEDVLSGEARPAKPLGLPSPDTASKSVLGEVSPVIEVTPEGVAGTESQIDAERRAQAQRAQELGTAEVEGAVQGRAPLPEIEPTIDESAREPDDLIKVISRAGGLSRGEAKSQGIDPVVFTDQRSRQVFGRPLFPKQGGMTMDGLAEFLSQRGFLPEGQYSANEALDLVDRALRGEKIYSTYNAADAFEKQAAEREADMHEQARGQAGTVGIKYRADDLRSKITAVQKNRVKNVLGDDAARLWEPKPDDFALSGYIKESTEVQDLAAVMSEGRRIMGDDAFEAFFERFSTQNSELDGDAFESKLTSAIRSHGDAQKPGDAEANRAGAGRVEETAQPRVSQERENLQASPPDQAGQEVTAPASADRSARQDRPETRRQDAEQRKSVAQMSPDELRRELLTDALTGLPNRRAYDESAKKPVQVAIDLDSLKWINDFMNHESGDRAIEALGQALRESGLDAYHISGDEFMVQGEDRAVIEAGMTNIRSRLDNAVIHFEHPDGSTTTKTGVHFSYGIGATRNEADTALSTDKANREASGRRAARGEAPGGVERRAKAQPDNQDRSAANQEVTPPEQPPDSRTPRAGTEPPSKEGVSFSATEKTESKPDPSPQADMFAPMVKAAEAMTKAAEALTTAVESTKEKPNADRSQDENDNRSIQAAKDTGKENEGDISGVLESTREESAVDAAAHEAATSPQNDLPQPTEEMKKAGNYKKGKINISGLDISIENPEGSERSGKDASGKPWSITMRSHYGYIARVDGNTAPRGKDKDHIDLFIKPGTPENYSGPVFVIDQVNKDGAFDEHKTMLGYDTAVAAKQGYLENYTPGWTGLGAMRKFSLGEFKLWLKSGNTKKPVALKGRKLVSKSEERTASLVQKTSASTNRELEFVNRRIQELESRKTQTLSSANELRMLREQRSGLSTAAPVEKPAAKAEATADNGDSAVEAARLIGESNPDGDVAELRSQVLKDHESADIDDVTEALHEGQYQGIRKIGESMRIKVLESDISKELANRAFNGTSHTPEKRAKVAIRDYVRTMVDAWSKAEAGAKTPEDRLRLTEQFRAFKDGYVSRLNAYLSAHSRVMSAFIVGPAKFPTSSNAKKSNSADNRMAELIEWDRKGIKRLMDAAKGPTDKTPAGELEVARRKLQERQRLQEAMKAANKVVRDKNLSDDQKVVKITGLGLSERLAREALKPDFMDRTGFPDYAMKNNNAEIRRLTQRVAELEGKQQKAEETGGSQEIAFDGGIVEFDYANGVLRIRHNAKPPVEVRDQLKREGFHWSPTNTAWQRKITDNAIAAAERITGAELKAKEADSDAPQFSRDSTDATSADRNGISLPNGIDENLKEKAYALEEAAQDAGAFKITSARLLDAVLKDNAGKITADLKAVKILQDLFGAPVAFLTATSKFKFHGVYHNGTIWLNPNSPLSLPLVFGHELSHRMKADNPSAYRALLKAISPMFRNVDAYEEKNNLYGMKDNLIAEEMLGDVMGDRFGEPEFWQQVAANTNRSEFHKIIDVIRLWIGRAIARLRGLGKDGGLGSKEFIGDLEAARKIIAKAVAEYAQTRKTGLSVSNEPQFSRDTTPATESGAKAEREQTPAEDRLRQAMRASANAGLKIARPIAKAAATTNKVLDVVTAAPFKLARTEKWLPQSVDWLLDQGARLVPEKVKAGTVSDYGLTEKHTDRRTQVTVGERKLLRRTMTVLDRIAGLNRAESSVAYQWMQEKPDTVREQALLNKLPAESRNFLKELKQQITEMGKEAVRLGMLSQESFDRNNMSYLHRTYASHEFQDKSVQKQRSRAIKVMSDAWKGRGMRDDVNVERLDHVEQGKKYVRMDLRGDDGRRKRSVYIPEGEPIQAQYTSWKRDGVWEARWIGGGDKVGMWRDLTPEERQRLGELDEIRFAVLKTVHEMARDIEVAKFLEWVADNESRDSEDGIDPEHIKGASESLASAYKKDDWVLVPETTIPRSGGTKVYGKLAGKYVPGPVWNDIRQAVKSSYKPWGETYAFLMKAFKVSKTALSPVVHTNNVFANFLMADWHDVDAKDMHEAAWVLVNRESGAEAKELWERFEDSGATIGMFAHHEIKREQLAPLLDQLRKEIQGLDETDAKLRVAGILSDVIHGRAADAVAAIKQGKAYAVGEKVVNFQIDLYQREDEFFRLATFLKGIREGKPDLQAGKDARKSFLDYDINAPWIQAARHTVFPFISFPYRALPMFIDIAKNKPWKLAKLMLVASLLNAFGYMMSGGDEDDERAFLPDEKAGKIWGIVPKLIRMPWNDENEDPVFLDVRRWVPLGDFFDVGATNSALPLSPVMIPGGPLAVAAELISNRSNFTDKDITKDTDFWYEQAGDVASHLYKAMAPNAIWVPGSYASAKLWTATGGADGESATDAFGREYSVPQALFSSFGIKVASYPTDNLKRNAIFEYQADKAEINRVISHASSQKERNLIDQEQYENTVAKQVEKLKRLDERFALKSGKND